MHAVVSRLSLIRRRRSVGSHQRSWCTQLHYVVTEFLTQDRLSIVGTGTGTATSGNQGCDTAVESAGSSGPGAHIGMHALSMVQRPDAGCHQHSP